MQPPKDGDVIEVFADEDGVTRVIASEDGGFTRAVVGEARRCSVAARVQPAVAARCSRWAVSIYCCWGRNQRTVFIARKFAGDDDSWAGFITCSAILSTFKFYSMVV